MKNKNKFFIPKRRNWVKVNMNKFTRCSVYRSRKRDLIAKEHQKQIKERDAKWDDICGAMARVTESLCDGEGCGYQDVDIEKGK